MADAVLANDVKETTTTAGMGTLSLDGAASNSRTFVTGVGNGKWCPYKIDNGAGDREYTWGLVTAGTPATLSRGQFISSTTGSRIDFGAGTKTVSLVSAAELFLLPGVSPALAETDIASATTTDLGPSGSVFTLRARITGTTTITSFGTMPNALRWVRFAGALTLTHNATSLILLGGANRKTAADDVGLYISDASGNWRELFYSMKKTPFCHVRLGSSQSVTTATETRVNYDTVDTDTHSYWDATNKRYTPLIPGRYRVTLNILWTGSGSIAAAPASINEGYIRKNGSKVAYIFNRNEAAYTGQSGAACNLSAEVQLNGSTDYIDAALYTDWSSTITLAASAPGNFMQISYIGP